jgi:HD-GYP domain-containing protein (c-di-GMP phosphodiesterase class II)
MNPNDQVRALVDRLERHHPGAKGHSARVAVYSVATGEALGLRGDDLLNLRRSAELHDLGLLSVSAEILASARPLEPEERQSVQRHPALAAEYLPDEEWVYPLLPIIGAHHERWAGGGYPEGDEGISIPFGARIIAAAEALDVMLHGAPWRPTFPEEAAVASMRGLSGKWFEPSVVDALLRVQPLIQPVILPSAES